MKYISVFCGSSSGAEEIFTEKATVLGKAIARKGYGVVYGGAHVGLMGAVANGALSEKGEVIGVLPRFLQKKELEHKSLTRIYIVDTMHERKAMMNKLCDAVVALPGGYGTMEELFEMLTWGQLALHKKPIALLNVEGFYDPLVALSEKMIEKGFLKEEYRDLLIVDDDIEKLLLKMESYVPPKNEKWFETK
ncbi:LOG family protein [Dysgonomonas sp.]|jgi:uncharacterized protein (TIGR00730 family)|nr:TIGR00730 family Rossman fold protein [Prevotella sp.]